MLKTDVNFIELGTESAVGVLCWAYKFGGLATEEMRQRVFSTYQR